MHLEDNWWEKPSGERHFGVMAHIQEIERNQGFLFERFHKLSCAYDPYFERLNGWDSYSQRSPESTSSVNVIASSVDTVAAIISATDVRARFMTDDGDWTTQRTARHLEWYAEGVGKQLDIAGKCRAGFQEAALKGTGLVKVYVDWYCNEVRVEPVLVDDIIVDEGECRSGGQPRQMAQRMFIDREELIAQFPDHEDEIRKAQKNGTWRDWAGYRSIRSGEVVACEVWRLPIGKKGSKYYRPGLHGIYVDGCDLFNERWEKHHFPFARMVWSRRPRGWYGIGGAERIAGKQRTINKREWQIERQLDQIAVPIRFVRQADAALAVKTMNRAGATVVYKSDKPETQIPPAVSPETYADRSNQIDASYEEFGVSRLTASAKKPSGIDSGAALREYRDSTTQRFAIQEKNFEQFVLDALWLTIDCCKDLGADAPVITRKTRYGIKKIPWNKVDMGECRVQMQAASTLARTPAGRMQMVLEWAQAGVISQDEARRLLRHPDLERAMSLYTAAVEDLELAIEEILEGIEDVAPEPHQNLKLGVWRMQQALLKAHGDKVPDEILDLFRQWIAQALFLLGLASPTMQPGPADMAPQPGAPLMPPPGPMGGGGMMPQDMMAPPQAPVVSAMAPESIGIAPA